jgi:hypothetical protein
LKEPSLWQKPGSGIASVSLANPEPFMRLWIAVLLRASRNDDGTRQIASSLTFLERSAFSSSDREQLEAAYRDETRQNPREFCNFVGPRYGKLV